MVLGCRPLARQNSRKRSIESPTSTGLVEEAGRLAGLILKVESGRRIRAVSPKHIQSAGWLGRKDSNLQPSDPESAALPLRHSPKARQSQMLEATPKLRAPILSTRRHPNLVACRAFGARRSSPARLQDRAYLREVGPSSSERDDRSTCRGVAPIRRSKRSSSSSLAW